MLKVNELVSKQKTTQKRSSSLTSVISKVAFAESKVLYDNFELLNIINYQTYGEAAQFKANMNIKLDKSAFKSESRLVTFLKSLWATIKRIFKSIIYKLTGVSMDWVKREDYLKKRARTAMRRQNNYKKYTKFRNGESSMGIPGYLFPLLKNSSYYTTKNISTMLKDVKYAKLNMISAFSRVIKDAKTVENDTDISALMFTVNSCLGNKQSDFKKLLENITIIHDVFSRKNKGLRPYKIEDFENDFHRLFFGSDSLMLNDHKENRYVSGGDYISLKDCIDILNFKDLEPTVKRLYSVMEKVMGKIMASIQSGKSDSIYGTKKIEKSFNELKQAQENFQKLNVVVQKIPKLLHNIFDLYEEIIVIYEKAFVLDRDTFEKNKKTI